MKKPLQIQHKQWSVRDFIGWQSSKALRLSPKFQRRRVWKPAHKSYLIDTILRGYPIPSIFLRELKTNLDTYKTIREVVDGQQRIRTLIEFIAPETLKAKYAPAPPPFEISKDDNTKYGGKTFKQLPDEVRDRILDYEFNVFTLMSNTGDQEVLQIFARMNATGVRLNDQELRNAEFFGKFKKMAYKLAGQQLNRWEKWKIFTPYNIARMDEVKLSSELIILILRGISEGSDKVISGAYGQFDKEFEAGPEVERRFSTMFEEIENNFDSKIIGIFNKQALFYALFASNYDLQFGLGSDLSRSKPNKISERQINNIFERGKQIAGGSAPPNVLDSKTRRTTHVQERRILAEFLNNRID